MGCIEFKGAHVEPFDYHLHAPADNSGLGRHSDDVRESLSWTAGMSSRHQQQPRRAADIHHSDTFDPEVAAAGPNQFFDSYHDLSESELHGHMVALSELFSDGERSLPGDVVPVVKMSIPFMAPSTGDAKIEPDQDEKPKVVLTSPFDGSLRYVVDDPDGYSFGVAAFPRGNEELMPDDTIWTGKKELMNSYLNVRSIDQHAIKAAGNLRLAQPQKIVSYLTKVAKNDFQRFRVLFRWVSHAIGYEFSVLSKGVPSERNPLDILEEGSGDSCDIAVLLQYLSSMAGVTCEVITGYNKNVMPGRPPLIHSWNRVRLRNRWFLADCTAALHSSVSSCVPEKFREYEFLSEPRYFHSRRIPKPLDRYGEQLPYTSYEHFNRMPTFGPMASVCDLKCISHSMGVVKADDENKVRIDLTTSVPLMTWASLTSSKSFLDRREHVTQWWDGNVLHNQIDVPEDGLWEFKIFVQLVCDRGKDRDPNALIPPTVIDTGHCHLATFTVVAHASRENTKRLAPDSGMCGIALTCSEIRPLSHRSPFVEAENGKAEIAVLMPDYSIKMVYRFLNVDMPYTFITSRVYMERVGNAVLIHVFCPKAGRYALRLLINNSKEGKEYTRQGEYLIHNGEDVAKPMRFSETLGYHVWGPNGHFTEYGMNVCSGHSSSTIVARDGEVQLQMSWPTAKEFYLSCCLQDIKKDDRLQAGRVIVDTRVAQDSLSVTTFHIRMKECGCFVLQVYVRIKETTTNKRVGGWLIVVNKKSIRPWFPEEGLVCGPNDIFYKLGLKTGLAKMETHDGKARIDISYDSDFEKSFRYEITSASHNRLEDVVNVTTSVKKKSSLLVTSFLIQLPVPSVYAIRIMTIGDGFEWHAIGTWIVLFDNSRASSIRDAGPGGRQSIRV